MRWRFWKKPSTDETILEIHEGSLTSTRTLYVKAQSSDKALELMEKLREKAKT